MKITDQRLQELISLAVQDPNTSDWHRDTDAALVELQSLRRSVAELAKLGRERPVAFMSTDIPVLHRIVRNIAGEL